MCAAKKKKAASQPPSARLVSWLWGRGRPFTLVVLIAVALFGLWSAVWYGAGVGEYILSTDQYQVTYQQVEITPLPPWIHSDIRAVVFRNASLDGPLSIMDDNLNERISTAFSLHPWVEKVERVSKHHPARIEVELVYRRPVCMVELAGDLLPVDGRGILLPRGDFSPVEAGRYPRLVGIDTAPVGTTGEAWGDVRVLGGAEIANALADVWQQLGLAQIRPSDALSTGVDEEHTYTLLTRGGTRVFWGRAPGSDALGEIPARDKVARLTSYFQEHGTLEGRGGAQVLDVYQLRVTSVPEASTPQ